MVLWRLRGYVDPEGEYRSRDGVCSLQKRNEGYRLLVEHGNQVQVDERHGSVQEAQARAEALRAKLIKQGWNRV